MRWTLCVLLAAIGCGPKAGPAEEPAQQDLGTSTKRTSAVVTPPTVTVDEVGGLDADAEVDQASLQAAFPGFVVRTATRSSEGEELEVYELYRGDQLSLTVEPGTTGKVYRVAIVDPGSKTPDGIGVGASYEELQEAVPDHECFRLVEERSDSVACYGKTRETIGYVLGGAAKDQKPGAVPSPAQLASSSVTEILWLPES